MSVSSVPTRDSFEGCLLGHALGDAAGAPVEFLPRSTILRTFGPDGVRGLEPWDGFPKGSYTDDTQMMLATAEGLLRTLVAWRGGAPADPVPFVYGLYLDWCARQSDPRENRRPGATCMSALQSGKVGDSYEAINDSKGSGGVMRVSPVGLAHAPEHAFEVAVDIAAITHGHPTGYLSAGFFADVVSRVVRGSSLPEAVADTREVLTGYEDHDETLEAVDHAVELYMSDIHPVEAVGIIGEGWIAEEALGVALFCALSYPDDWYEGVLASVNITGDSDTTGCLTGALLGAILGSESLPSEWLEDLEERGTIQRLAGDLHAAYVLDGPIDAERHPRP